MLRPVLRTTTSSTPQNRNPFAGKGLAMSVALLLAPDHGHTVTELAAMTGATVSMASRVVRDLQARRLVVGDVTQGRRAAIRPRRRLYDEVADRWPQPVTWILGGRPSTEHPVGGSVALESLDIVYGVRPRVYIRRRNDLTRLLARCGGYEVVEPVAEWEIAVLDLDLPPGPVPPVILALELAGHPRGQETFETYRDVFEPHLPEE